MPRRKRVLLWAGLLVLLAGVGMAGVLWVTPAPSRISHATVERIQPGMAKSEVERLLGGPPGDYTTRPLVSLMDSTRLVPPVTPVRWLGDQGEVAVYFDQEERVSDVVFHPCSEPRETFLARFRRWLGL
jgi:hypothetical protein